MRNCSITCGGFSNLHRTIDGSTVVGADALGGPEEPGCANHRTCANTQTPTNLRHVPGRTGPKPTDKKRTSRGSSFYYAQFNSNGESLP